MDMSFRGGDNYVELCGTLAYRHRAFNLVLNTEKKNNF